MCFKQFEVIWFQMCDLTSLGTHVMENEKKNSFFVLQGQVTHID